MSFFDPQTPGIAGLDELTSSEELLVQSIAALGDPGEDRILFWDDSAGAYAYLTAGSGLTITDTTITASSSAAVGGSDTQVQFNDGGSFGGSAQFIFDKNTDTLHVNLIQSVSDGFNSIDLTNRLLVDSTGVNSIDWVNRYLVDSIAGPIFYWGGPELQSVGTISPYTSDGAALGSTTNMWSDIFLASGAVINFNNGDVTLTHSLSAITLDGGDLALGANNLTMTGSIGATGARVTKGWFADLEVTNAIVGSVTGNAATVTTNANLTGPITSSGNATSIASQTGTGTKFVVDTSPTLVTPILGVATATSINKVAITAPATSATLTIANGKTLTANNSITLAGTDSTTMTFPSTSATIARTDAANTFTGASTASAWVLTSPTITTKISPTTDDGAPLGDTTHNFSDLFLASGAVINFVNGDVTITHSTNTLTFAGASSGYLYDAMNAPSTNDAAALGSTTLMWSDLFLASGSVINWNNGDVTLTHASNLLTLAGGQFTFGANTAYFAVTDNGNSGTSDTIDWTLGNKQKSTLTGNCTFTFTAPGGPCNLILECINDGTVRTITWPASVKWSGGTGPTFTGTSGRSDIISFYYNGTVYYGTYTLNHVNS